MPIARDFTPMNGILNIVEFPAGLKGFIERDFQGSLNDEVRKVKGGIINGQLSIVNCQDSKFKVQGFIANSQGLILIENN